MPTWVYTLIAVSVVFVWVQANIVALITGTTVDPQLHYVMGVVAGGAYGGRVVEKQKEKNNGG
jgi:uncharacterized membrane-anchored protein